LLKGKLCWHKFLPCDEFGNKEVYSVVLYLMQSGLPVNSLSRATGVNIIQFFSLLVFTLKHLITRSLFCLHFKVWFLKDEYLGWTNLSPICAEPAQKIISWKRTASSRSSSSRNALATKTKEDIDDSGSDFVEEFCMIAGSHSSTLDRLYAWERKLYDEVKVLQFA